MRTYRTRDVNKNNRKKMDTHKNDNHTSKLNQPNGNGVKISFCVLVLLIFTSELLVGYYLQTSITSDAKERYVSKLDLPDLLVHLLREEQVKSAIGVLVRELDGSEKLKLEKLSSRQKRGALAVDDNLVTSQGHKEGANVEFFNPKLRHELEAKDEVERARTGNKGAAPGGDAWVWLTSYSRIPVSL